MKRKIAVILAADIAGYSKLVAEDEEETLRRLAVFRSVFSELVNRFQGRIFNTAGDSVLAEFQSAVDAVRCAVDVQETLRARNHAYPASRHMKYRMGIAIGDIVERDGDLLGDGVNIAARLESIAAPGGICISRSVHEAVASKLTLKFTDAGMKQLKNIPDPVRTYMVSSDDPDDSAVSSPAAKPFWASQQVMTVGGAAVIAALLLLAFVGWPGADDPAAPETAPAVTSAEPAKGKTEPAAPATSAEAAPATETEEATQPPEAAPKSTTATETNPEPATTEPATEVAKTERTDWLTSRFVRPRQMKDCTEGSPSVAVAACRTLTTVEGMEDDERSQVRYRLGRALREEGDVDGALKEYDEAIRLKPTADAYIHRGVAYYDKKDAAKAEADYTEALRLDPKSAEAANNRAWLRYTTGDFDAALKDANQAIRLNGSLAYIWDTRAHIHEKLGNTNEAVRDFRKAIQLDPTQTAAQEGLTRLGASP